MALSISGMRLALAGCVARADALELSRLLANYDIPTELLKDCVRQAAHSNNEAGLMALLVDPNVPAAVRDFSVVSVLMIRNAQLAERLVRSIMVSDRFMVASAAAAWGATGVIGALYALADPSESDVAELAAIAATNGQTAVEPFLRQLLADAV